MKPIDHSKFEPGRPVYVLLHKDHTHFHCLPHGEVDWDYDKKVMDLREQILRKDFDNFDYNCIDLATAWPIFCNRQADLVKLWTPTINLIRKSRSIMERRAIYQRFFDRRKAAHPLEADALLKRLLRF